MLRLSTAQMFRNGAAAIGNRQSEVARLQTQLATGKRIASLAEDPAAASGAAIIRSDLSSIAQYEANRQVATERLSATESTLGMATETLQSARELLVAAGNGGFNDADRATIATQLGERLSTLIGFANAQDGRGGYLFGGYREDAPPFVANGNSVLFVGDDGGRAIDVSSSRSVDTSFNGADVFSRIRTGNGVFATSAALINAGTGLIDGGHVTDATALTGDSYELRFHNVAGVVTYDVWNTTTNASVSTGQPYASPKTAALPGLSVTISGKPAEGDTFTVAPSTNRDVFATLRSAIDLLSTPGASPTTIANGLRATLDDVDRGLDRVIERRGSAGARLAELDQVGLMASQRDVDLQSTLSRLEDVDYASTIVEFGVAQTGLQAALDSYARISKITLFDYLK